MFLNATNSSYMMYMYIHAHTHTHTETRRHTHTHTYIHTAGHVVTAPMYRRTLALIIDIIIGVIPTPLYVWVYAPPPSRCDPNSTPPLTTTPMCVCVCVCV